jgi:hypothetical protein
MFRVASILLLACLVRSAVAQDRALFAYVSLPAFDRDSRPVMRTDGERLNDGFCLYWQPGWLRNYDHLPRLGDKNWWSSISYTIDPIARQITVYRLWGPDAVATPGGGWRIVGASDVAFQAKGGKGIVVPMYEQPQADWPCTEETWRSAAQERTYYPPSAAPGPPRNTDLYPRPSAVNPCISTTGHRIPGCH